MAGKIYYLAEIDSKEVPEYIIDFGNVDKLTDTEKVRLINQYIDRRNKRDKRFTMSTRKFIRLITEQEYIDRGGEIIKLHDPTNPDLH